LSRLVQFVFDALDCLAILFQRTGALLDDARGLSFIFCHVIL